MINVILSISIMKNPIWLMGFVYIMIERCYLLLMNPIVGLLTDKLCLFISSGFNKI